MLSKYLLWPKKVCMGVDGVADVPAHSTRLNQMSFIGPFQPSVFYDSMPLYLSASAECQKLRDQYHSANGSATTNRSMSWGSW